MSQQGAEAEPSSNRTEEWLWAQGSQAQGAGGPWAGKWMPRVSAADVDEVWVKVAAATEDGLLGTETKVSTVLSNVANPRADGPGTHVICAYTRDCRDLEDVGRVLAGLRSLGFEGRLSYKEGGATHAGIYGRGASLYVAQPGSLDVEPRREAMPVPASEPGS